MPRSNSSHPNVRGSPSGSVADPVRANGVWEGIVYAAPASTVGAEFAVAVLAAQEAPPPVVT